MGCCFSSSIVLKTELQNYKEETQTLVLASLFQFLPLNHLPILTIHKILSLFIELVILGRFHEVKDIINSMRIVFAFVAWRRQTLLKMESTTIWQNWYAQQNSPEQCTSR